MTTLPPNTGFASFIKPTIDTLFHIDYSWWEEQNLDLGVQLVAHLPAELREVYAGQRVDERIDLIDWETGEVQQVQGLQYLIATRCGDDPAYIMQAPTLIEAVFRVFLSNGNQPLSARALSRLVGQPADRVLRVMSGGVVRKGLRPMMD
ncbi:MAG TPA: hypothetical protein PKH77_20600 [Anaerolineae bacterium]|nr:hypothetical protein [Anaerolineae bacterium]